MVMLPFRFLAGALCVDFVNTVGYWTRQGPVREKFRGPADLRRWARETELSRPGSGVFPRAIALRRALHSIFAAAARGKPPAEPDLDLLNRELARARRRLVYHRDYRLDLDFLGAIADSAVRLLASPDLARLRECGGVQCGWMFLDTSRNRARQWCDMRVCGNRAKARKFRERRKYAGEV